MPSAISPSWCRARSRAASRLAICRPASTRSRASAAEIESARRDRSTVEGGKTDNVELALAEQRAPALAPAWPHRVPEEQIKSVSQTLPAGDGQDLVEARCTTCHDVERIVVKRTTLPEWQHIIDRMRGQMGIQNIPDISNQDAATIASYLYGQFQAGAATTIRTADCRANS